VYKTLDSMENIASYTPHLSMFLDRKTCTIWHLQYRNNIHRCNKSKHFEKKLACKTQLDIACSRCGHQLPHTQHYK